MSQHRTNPWPGIPLGEIATAIDGELVGNGERLIRGVTRPLDVRGDDEIALAIQLQGLADLERSAAKTAVLARGMEVPHGRLDGHILVDQPRHALALLLRLFERPPRLAPGIHPSAVIEPSARIAPDATIGALSYIGEEVEIAGEVRILSQVTVAAGSRIGEQSLLYPGVRIGERTRIGKRVIIHENACIGSDGFSIAITKQTTGDCARSDEHLSKDERIPLRIPSLGRVVLEDNVEVGACTTIDRATVGDTRIKRGAKIDNLVMVAHNNSIGENCVIAGQSGFAGSCSIGDRVVIGGRSGVSDHVRVGDDVVLAAGTGVSDHVKAGTTMIGFPALPYAKWRERYRNFGRLKRFFVELKALGQRIRALEQRVDGADSSPSQKQETKSGGG